MSHSLRKGGPPIMDGIVSIEQGYYDVWQISRKVSDQS